MTNSVSKKRIEARIKKHAEDIIKLAEQRDKASKAIAKKEQSIRELGQRICEHDIRDLSSWEFPHTYMCSKCKKYFTEQEYTNWSVAQIYK
jgi:predicted  nucleic acid-binding Zn-ribbon protein